MRHAWRMALTAALVTIASLGMTAEAFAQGQTIKELGGNQRPKKNRPHDQSPLQGRICSFVTAEQLSAAVGAKISEPTAGGGKNQATCYYSYSDGSSRTVEISVKSGDSIKNLFMRKRGDGEVVSGLGREAVWLPNFSTLWVLTRNDEVLEVALTSAASSIRRDNVKQTATNLARKVLEQL